MQENHKIADDTLSYQEASINDGTFVPSAANKSKASTFKKNKFKFFVQNQLGVIISFLAFSPLVVLIVANKNLIGK